MRFRKCDRLHLVALLSLWVCLVLIHTSARGDRWLSEEGWTLVAPSADSRLVYVSESEGTDWAEATYYAPGDPEIGGDPSRPIGSIRAYRTLAAAYDVLRDGKPDWVLLKRGDRWDDGFSSPKWTKSGRSAEEPIVINAWGPTIQRPIVKDFRTRYGPNDPDDAFDHLCIIGVRFTEGCERLIGGEDMLIEDCYFDECPLAVQGLGPESGVQYLRNVKLRRNVHFGNYSTTTHAQNLFVHYVDGLLVEECVFDRGGWHPDIVGAEPTIYNHNVYIQNTTTGVTFRGNISARASSHGAQLRRGGLCEDNLFLQNPINLLIGSNQNDWPEQRASGIVRRNVMLDSRDILSQPRGFGLWFEMADGVDAYENIIAHQRTGSVGIGVNVGLTYRNLVIRDNIIYDWTKPGDPTRGAGLKFSNNPLGRNVIAGNSIQQPSGGRLILHEPTFAAFLYLSNSYHSSNDSDDWFVPGGDINAWIDASGEEDARSREAIYVEPSRTIESYMASLGRSATLDAFMTEARKQSRLNWRPAFTASAVNQYIRTGFAEATDSTAADLLEFIVSIGTHESGGLDDLRASDDQYIRTTSDRRSSTLEPFVLQATVNAVTASRNAQTLDVIIEDRISEVTGLGVIQLRNWQTGMLETVFAYALSPTDRQLTVSNLDAQRYVRASDGRIQAVLRHSVVLAWSSGGFESRFDFLEFRVGGL